MENDWTKRIAELEAEVAKLTTALKDKPDQSDLDAAVFRINHLEADNKRLRAFWEWSRLADKMTFEQYHWIGKEASHEG